MTKLRLLLIWLLTPLFCGVSFGLSYDLFDNLNGNLILSTSLNQQNINISLHAWNYYCYYVDDSNYSPRNNINLNVQTDPGYWNCSFGAVNILARTSFCFMASCDNQYFSINAQSYSSATIKVYEFDGPISLGGGSSSCEDDLSTCVSSLSTLQSNYNSCYNDKTSCLSSLSTLSWDYATCQSSLNSCQNNWSSCDTLYWVCVENLSGCNSDKLSLQNYNESLSSQLSECLSNSENWTWTSGSGLMLVNNSLFWYYNESLLSLPITNNLFLPLGYQWVLDSGNVLYISALSGSEPEQYYFSDDDKVSIIDLLSYLFIFILWIGVIFSLIKLFKKLFTH